MKIEPQSPKETAEVRKAYTPPRLTVHGSAQTLTANNAAGPNSPDGSVTDLA